MVGGRLNQASAIDLRPSTRDSGHCKSKLKRQQHQTLRHQKGNERDRYISTCVHTNTYVHMRVGEGEIGCRRINKSPLCLAHSAASVSMATDEAASSVSC